jgi:osmotically-inducible protein OsmY
MDPKEIHMSIDSNIRFDVESELQRDPRIADSLVGVIVRDGVVTLTGQTSQYGAKWAAEEAATRIHGVRAVANEIQIKFLESGMRSDTDIAEAAANALCNSMATAPNGIHCVVQDGIVMLSGKVLSGDQKIAAENSVRCLTGVKGLLNDIVTTTTVTAKGVDLVTT